MNVESYMATMKFPNNIAALNYWIAGIEASLDGQPLQSPLPQCKTETRVERMSVDVAAVFMAHSLRTILDSPAEKTIVPEHTYVKIHS
jgi:hypothetical protein